MPKQLATFLCTVVGATTVWVATADAAPPKPEWCKVDGADGFDGNYPRDAVKEKDPATAIQLLVENMCDPDSEAAQMYKELEIAQKRWSKTLDMTDADWKDAASWVVGVKDRYGNPDPIDSDSRTLSSLDPIEQYYYFARPSSSNMNDYYADALGTRLTDVGRMGYVEKCLGGGDVGSWAVCHGDLLAFDFAKISTELRTVTKRPGYSRMKLRLIAFDLKPKVAEQIAAVKALEAKDEVYKKLFAIGAESRKTWEARYGTESHKLMEAMDDARLSNSRKAFEGCKDTTWAAFEKALGKIPAKSFEGMVEDPGVMWIGDLSVGIALDSWDVYLAAAAMYVCENQERSPGDISATFANSIQGLPGGRRGPRTEGQLSMRNANLEPDNRQEDIRFSNGAPSIFSRNGSRNGTSGRGVIASLKKNGNKTTVTFKSEMDTQDVCENYKETNKVSSIAADGTITYRGWCTKWRTEKIDRKSDPVDVENRYLADVKKGNYLEVFNGIVTIAYPKKGAKTPSAIWGVAVK